VTTCQNISQPSLVIYIFATPPIKMKLGVLIGRGLIVGNHLDQSLWLANLTMVLISRKQPKNLNVKEGSTFYTKTWHCHHFTCKGVAHSTFEISTIFGDTLKQWIELCSLSSYIISIMFHVSPSPSIFLCGCIMYLNGSIHMPTKVIMSK
jgi:hypothetical protein